MIIYGFFPEKEEMARNDASVIFKRSGKFDF